MPELTVAAFNLRWGADAAGRPYDVTAVVAAIDADVVVLPEAWRPATGPSFIERAAGALGMERFERTLAADTIPGPVGMARRAGPPGSWGLAVLSRLPVTRRTDVDLGRAVGDPVARRFAVCVEVDVGGSAFLVGGIHASHKLWGSLPQVGRLDAFLRDRGVPSVIAGDLNMWGPVVKAVVPRRRRAVKGATWPSGLPHSQIDHLFVDRSVEVLGGEVLGPMGSDHRPVRARLRIPDQRVNTYPSLRTATHRSPEVAIPRQ